jgi:rhodanese-related sulfurtransferase
MKWGMSAWHSDFAADWWDAKISNARATEFTDTPASKGPEGSLPEISTGATTGEEILKARVAKVLADGFDPVKVTSQQVFDNPDNYYIVNYWSEAHYSDPGHIPGAIQYTPKETIKLAADLKTLPTDKTVVVYCYTGQTSAFLCAYLRILGYDAKSLVYGTNGMIYDLMDAKGDMTIWDESQKHEYDYVQ